ncbi:S8 family peptidase [Cytophaga aurantiaca]|uniref:S8 family peptidase n=1 Tax=Cytophaga aurantiaca TaxID=29530 RepID=UPI00036937EA|nr:S8 family serine peptidase [Cytophaga aurantiaca]
MVLRSRIVCILFFYFFAATLLFAQTNSYILYLADKQGTQGTLDNPSDFLSVRSIDKRIAENIELDSTDLPVSQNYIDLLTNAGAEIIYTSKWLNAVCIKAIPAVYTTVSALPFVKNSSEMYRTSGAPNTQSITGTLQHTNYATNYSDFMGITQMHEKGLKGEGIMIAITDAGFPGVDTLTAFRHLWNNNQIVYYFDVAENESNVFNDDSHGTFMLSVLGADTNNYKGIVPDADYVLLRTEVGATESKLEEYNWLRAAEIADSCGVDIISVSLSYTTYDSASDSYTYADMNGNTSIIARAADMAYAKGMIVVCSAGNEGTNAWKYIGTPADARNVLAVGSVEANNSKSGFSSFGPSADGRIKPDLCALGSNIYCIKPDGSIFSTGGTSLATPMIAGILAGLKQQYPNLSNDVLKSLLLQSCDNFTHPTNQKGHGVPYFPNTVAYTSVYSQNSKILIAPNPYQSGQLILKVPETDVLYTIEIFDNQGKLVLNQSLIAFNNMIELSAFVRSYSQGIYFISIESINARETLKWIKI